MPLVEGQRTPKLRGLRYLGGHPAAPSELDRIDASFDSVGVRFERRGTELGLVRWDDVQDLSADAVLTTYRMTLPRVWFLGVLAAAFPKRERRVLLRLADRRGAWLFEVDGISLSDLRTGIALIRQRCAA
jgi:hypothetical protein